MPVSNEELEDVSVLPRSAADSNAEWQQQSKPSLTATDVNEEARPFDWLPTRLRFLSHGFGLKAFALLQGPRPPRSITLRSWAPQTKTENWLLRGTRPVLRFKWLLVPLILAVWIVAVALLTRESWFSSENAELVSTGASFWLPNAQCGLNGTDCAPFDNSTLLFRCPADPVIKLLNPRTIGADQVNLKTLIVGGGDALTTYRADSWLCATAYQQGFVSKTWGGCATATQIGAFTNFTSLSKRGLTTIPFDTTFPSAYRLSKGSGHCKDLKYPILAFNVVMLWLFSVLLRPKAALLFWVSYCVGFWQIAVTASPPNFSDSFGTFLPAMFMAYVFWRVSYRFLMPSFDVLLLERSILFLGPFWVGVMMDQTIETWVNADRLTASDIHKTGTLPAVIVIGLILLGVAINQFRTFWLTGWLPFYLIWYACGGIVIGILAALPDLTLRIHHYIMAIFLIPLVPFPTRLSLIMGAFLLGMFLNGAALWGFDSILQTAAELRRDAALGSDLPEFNVSGLIEASGNITWNPIPAALTASWNGFGLIVDDVLTWSGNGTSFNISGLDASLPHYFRVGYELNGSFGDFTKAGQRLANGTWIAPAPGAG